MTVSQDTKKENKAAPSRRSFLKLAGTAPLAAAATTVGAQAAEAQVAQDTSGLQDTDHTRTYYQLARF